MLCITVLSFSVNDFLINVLKSVSDWHEGVSCKGFGVQRDVLVISKHEIYFVILSAKDVCSVISVIIFQYQKNCCQILWTKYNMVVRVIRAVFLWY